MFEENFDENFHVVEGQIIQILFCGKCSPLGSVLGVGQQKTNMQAFH